MTLPLGVRLRLKLGLYVPTSGRAYSAVFASLLPRIAGRGVRTSSHPSARSLARAVDAIGGRGLDPAEGQWIERIECRRAEFAARRAPILIKARHHPAGTLGRELAPRELACVASLHRPWGIFLLRLVRELRPRSVVELGTGIGISAAYQGAALELNGEGRLLTVDGSPQLVELARETLSELEIHRVEVVAGAFDEVLEGVLARAAPIDLAYLDAGKSRKHLDLQLERLRPHLAPGAALVIDDIHWSREMSRAWRAIRAADRVALDVDLWRLGVCLLPTGRV